MADPDLLFNVRNNFYLGSYQHAISEASDLESLVEQEKIERDLFVYRSYIELGSYEVNIIHMLAPLIIRPPPPRRAVQLLCTCSIYTPRLIISLNSIHICAAAGDQRDPRHISTSATGREAACSIPWREAAQGALYMWQH